MASRGELNNNPGNIVRTLKLWPGEKPWHKSTDNVFKQFETMEYGLQALMRNLLSYFRSGNNTITKILDKWDPKPDDNSNYILAVSKSTGFGPSQVLVPGVTEIAALTRAIVDFENGSNNITNEQIQEAAANLEKIYKKAPSAKIGGKKIFMASALVSAAFMYFNRD
jgi:hypothetical protein